jgi:hypothetical protein
MPRSRAGRPANESEELNFLVGASRAKIEENHGYLMGSAANGSDVRTEAQV